MAFSHRFACGNSFSDEVRQYFESEGYEVGEFGERQTLLDTDGGWEQRKRLPVDIRYRPDWIIKRPDRSFFLVDAKTGSKGYPTLEKNAYECYMRLDEQSELPVAIVSDRCSCPNDRNQFVWFVGLCYVGEIRWLDSESIVGGFPECQRWPVVDGWIQPPSGGKVHSGTPYRGIDPVCMRPIMLLDQWVGRFREG